MNINMNTNTYAIKIENVSSTSTLNTVEPGWFGGFSIFAKTDEKSTGEFRKFERDGHKYYVLDHNKEYGVRMINNSDLRVNAVLKIDGETMGKWRINDNSSVLIERPSHSNRRFTFVKDDSWQAESSGVKAGSKKNGLVEVVFIPEIRINNYDMYDSFNCSEEDYVSDKKNKKCSRSNYSNAGPNMRHANSNSNSNSIRSMSESANFSNNFSSGATVLGNDSSQTFSTATNIIEDTANSVTKRVRLVVSEQDRAPFISIKKKEYDDPVPPPVKKAKDFRKYDRDFARNFDPDDNYARPRINNIEAPFRPGPISHIFGPSSYSNPIRPEKYSECAPTEF